MRNYFKLSPTAVTEMAILETFFYTLAIKKNILRKAFLEPNCSPFFNFI